MRRLLSTMSLLAVAAAVCGALLLGCASESGSELAGTVVDDSISVQVPAIGMPAVDLDAGFAPAAGGAGGGAQASAAQIPAGRSALAAVTGLGQVSRVESVPAAAGDLVKAGDVLAVLDRAPLVAGLAAARANAAVAKAQPGVLTGAIDDVDAGNAKLADARAQASSATAKLARTRADLVAKRAELRRLLRAIENAGPPPSIPPSLPPGVTPPTPPNPAQLRAAIAQLSAGIAKIDVGLAKVRSGLSRLSGARATLADARDTLVAARRLARIAADASRVGVDVARWSLETATVRSPVDGWVVSAASVGDVLSPGATIATVRRDGPARVTAWVTPEQAAYISAQLPAISSSRRLYLGVSGDWSGGVEYPAGVVRVGLRAEYPPTSAATKEVHLTRAVPIELELEDTSVRLPAGAPVDIALD